MASSEEPPKDSPPYYEYMFETDKRPTKQLDALLRAVGKHIMFEIGDKTQMFLTPDKLAAFYKAVGGNYDSVFETPHSSISYIWQVTGCQHSLQPTENDFDPPSIPALTLRGFSRWESLELLLEPDEHVPFLQLAVKDWSLKHPETGELFPPDIPRDVFPLQADPEVDRWHKACADRMHEAIEADTGPDIQQGRPAQHHSRDTGFSHVHARAPYPDEQARPRHGESDYFSRPFSYAYVPGRSAGQHRSTARSPEDPRWQSPDYDQEKMRRKSFSDYASPNSGEVPVPPSHHGAYLNPQPNRPNQTRRHSHPRHAFDSSDDEHIDDTPKRRRPARSPPTHSVRFSAAPGGPPDRDPADASAHPNKPPPPTFRYTRPDSRGDDPRRRSGSSPLESLREKISGIWSNGGSKPSERPRSSRQNSNSDSARSRRTRESSKQARTSRSYSDFETDGSVGNDTTDDEMHRRRRMARGSNERGRTAWERGRASDLDRDHERDNSGSQRRDRTSYPRRPQIERRTSSHADVDRRRNYPVFDPRDGRDRDRDRDRDRAREDRKMWDKRVMNDRNASPVKGVSGRRYPEPAFS